jgi:hypothetical protein
VAYRVTERGVPTALGRVRGVAWLDDYLAGLFLEVGEVAQEQGVGVLFTIDEIQYLSKEHLAALIVGLRRVSQEQLPFMVVGAGLPSLPALAGKAKSYAERLFVDNVVQVAVGYPFFLQEFGKQAWDVAPGPDTISKRDVKAAIPIAIDELDTGFFRVRIDRTSDSERALIKRGLCYSPATA